MSQSTQDNADEQANSENKAAKTSRKGIISRARACVCLVVFLSVGVGLAFGGGWGTLSSFGIDAIAYICPLGALETILASHLFIPRTVITVVCVLLLLVVLGRAFCAWVCPIPPLQRFFHPHDTASGSVTHSCSSCAGACGLKPLGGARDGFRIDSRHGVLLGSLASAAVFGFPVFCLVCPIGLTFATFVAVWRVFANQEASWSLLVFPFILLLEIVVFRKWCHKICPMSALISLLSQPVNLLRPCVDKSVCLRSQGVDCQVCVDICPERLDPHAQRIPECTKCGLCVEQCPSHAVGFKQLGHLIQVVKYRR